jgi:hypothetical protein
VHDLAAEGLADRLVAEAHAEHRDRPGEAPISSSETPASFGVHGPGESTMRSAPRRCDLVHA